MAQPPENMTKAASTRPITTSRSEAAVRIKSEDLFQLSREVEIDHRGRIYRLRLTQLNKLILTA